MNIPADAPPRPSPGNGIARLLGSFAHGDPEEVLALDGLLQGLGRSAFGMFLFVSVLPGFVPIPGFAGVVSGPLVVLIGLQLMLGLRKPWVPGFIARRGPKRGTMARFCDRIAPWTARLERLVRPRLQALTGNRLANVVTGLLLIGLGLLLALPLGFFALFIVALFVNAVTLRITALLFSDGLDVAGWLSAFIGGVVIG
ncbi:MAG TPA: exopolysaccharide biosynthesis protein, partial [Pseudoxanthomonas sp.]|nr:exopolysaccharide biosynthesis protein [Pseudoxanthomonas sp.]